MDRLYDKIKLEAIRLAGTLDEKAIRDLSQDKISPSYFPLLAAKMKAASLDISDNYALEIFLSAIRQRNDSILRNRFPAIQDSGDYFIFPNISSAQDSIDDISLTKKLLENGAIKTHDEWRRWSLENNDRIVVPNLQILYQIMRRPYELRDNPSSKKVVKACVKGLQTDLDRGLHTGTKIRFGSGLEATIEHLQLDKSVQSITLDVPEFTKYNDNWSYSVLAKAQPESKLGNIEVIPDNAKPFLDALLGEGYEDAGAVCQYIASRNNNLLREVRLWVPTEKNRNSVGACWLGCNDDSFYLNSDGNLSSSGASRGVRKKIP